MKGSKMCISNSFVIVMHFISFKNIPFVSFSMIKEAQIDYFLIFINHDINID